MGNINRPSGTRLTEGRPDGVIVFALISIGDTPLTLSRQKLGIFSLLLSTKHKLSFLIISCDFVFILACCVFICASYYFLFALCMSLLLLCFVILHSRWSSCCCLAYHCPSRLNFIRVAALPVSVLRSFIIQRFKIPPCGRPLCAGQWLVINLSFHTFWEVFTQSCPSFVFFINFHDFDSFWRSVSCQIKGYIFFPFKIFSPYTFSLLVSPEV